MAESPNGDHDYYLHRSRSSSLSRTTGQFLYGKLAKDGVNGLIRSYSYDHFLAKNKEGQIFQRTQIQVLSFISPVKCASEIEHENSRKVWSMPKKLPVECKKRNAVKAKMALTFSGSQDQETSDSRKGKGKEKNSHKSIIKRVFNVLCNVFKISLYLNIIFGSLLLSLCIYRFRYCTQEWNIDRLAVTLQESVFGQAQAVQKTISALEEFSKSDSSIILVFTGSVGVGKTFVSSIIYNDFPWESNKYIYFPELNTKENLISERFSFCGSNLLIIDNINSSNAQTFLTSVNNLISTNANGLKFLVIPIVLTHSGEEKLVEDIIQESCDQCHHVPFKFLEQDDVRKCFDVELQKQKKYISQKALNEIVAEQMRYCHVAKGYLGCKHIDHQVSVLPEMI